MVSSISSTQTVPSCGKWMHQSHITLQVTTTLFLFGFHIPKLSLLRPAYPANIIVVPCHNFLIFSHSYDSCCSPYTKVLRPYGVHTKHVQIRLCPLSIISTTTILSSWLEYNAASSTTFACKSSGTRVLPPIIAWAFPVKYGNSSSARPLCCKISLDANSKSRGCNVAQSLLFMHYSSFWFSLAGLRCMYLKGMVYALNFFRYSKVLLYFYPVACHTNTLIGCTQL